MTDSSGPDIAQQLRDHGLQVTAQRIAVMEAVNGHPHAATEELSRLTAQIADDVISSAVKNSLTDS